MAKDHENSALKRVVNIIGLLVLVGVFSWSLWHVSIQAFFGGAVLGESDKREITFVHWQLEGRSVEAMQWAADEYMKLHPDVHVRQIGIPTGAYEQWVRTQLIGRKAPDLMEMWARDEWDSLAVRYFTPIADIVDKPNPYNAGTSLEGRPWRETYTDNMRGGYRPNLQEYYAAPLSVFTVRIYANRTLIDKAAHFLGKPSPAQPQTLKEFFRICEDINRYAAESGDNVVPISGSTDTVGQFRFKYLYMGFNGLNDLLDRDYDAALNYGDIIEAVCTNELNLITNPYIKAGHMSLYDICRYFPDGFMSASRSMGISLFVQGRAAMIATGSWEAGSIFMQVGDDFEIEVFDFPVAAKDNEKYGKYLEDRIGEAHVVSGFQFGVTRFSKNRELAIDFLHFLTSQKINEELNLRLKWFPAIEGAKTDKVLAAFEPRVKGLYNSFIIQHFYIGPGTQLSYDQHFPIFIESDPPTYSQWLKDTGNADSEAAQKSYNEFVESWRDKIYTKMMSDYLSDYRRMALDDFSGVLERSYHNLHTTETNIASVRAEVVRAGGALDEPRTKEHLRTLIYGQATRTLFYQQDVESYKRVEKILAESDVKIKNTQEGDK